MMAGVSVQQTAGQFLASAEKLRDSLKTRALVNALNRAADGVKTDASSEIRKTYRIKKATVDRAFNTQRATAGSLTAIVRVRGRPLSLAGFGARTNKRAGGVSVDVKGTRKVIRGAFLRTLRTGYDNEYQVVFIREGKSRYPIKALKTVDVPGLFIMQDINAAVVEGVNDRFEKEFQRLLRYYASTEG
jgi:hypothetical protein